MTDEQRLPTPLQTRIDAAGQRISAALGVAPDLTQDTLPLLDGYLRMVAAELETAERQRAIEELGVHFGEVLRRLFDARWALDDEDTPETWRLELSSCFLYLHPVGMTGEVLLGCESEAFDGSFTTGDESHVALEEMLAEAAPLSEQAYYSLSGRCDVLQLVADFLTTRHLVANKGKPALIEAEDYRRHVAERSGN